MQEISTHGMVSLPVFTPYHDFVLTNFCFLPESCFIGHKPGVVIIIIGPKFEDKSFTGFNESRRKLKNGKTHLVLMPVEHGGVQGKLCALTSRYDPGAKRTASRRFK